MTAEAVTGHTGQEEPAMPGLAGPTGSPDVVDVSDETLAAEPHVLIDRLNAELVRHQRLSHSLKTIMSGWAPSDLDWGSLQVLVHLVKDGPQRQGELAECILLDASTVSRRVAALVKLGYARRLPDPVDGRAVRLAATDAGVEVFDRFRVRRAETMHQILSTWPADEVSAFLTLLSRLNDDLDAYRPLLARTTAADPIPPFPVRGTPGSPTVT
jgi:DNA-binding MarR family transcriptional regulator